MSAPKVEDLTTAGVGMEPTPRLATCRLRLLLLSHFAWLDFGPAPREEGLNLLMKQFKFLQQTLVRGPLLQKRD